MTQKPLILAEVGSGEPTRVNELMGKLRSGGYGRVRALVWFDQGTWQLDGNPTVLSAVRNLMSVLG